MKTGKERPIPLFRRYALHILMSFISLMAIIFPVQTTTLVQFVAQFFLQKFDWLILGGTTAALLACLLAGIGPWGKLRIGGAYAVPTFSVHSWFAMLFAAGMGTGLVFWGVAEPVIFSVVPPPGGALAQSPEAVRDGFALTLFHWTLHAWAIYAVCALCVGYAAAKRSAFPLPSAPFPMAPDWLKRGIDTVALLAVIFGIVASLGQGGIQMGAGVERISNGVIPDSVSTRIGLIIFATMVFLMSTWQGLEGGIKPLSQLNMLIALVLLIFVFLAGPTASILKAAIVSGTAYLGQVGLLSMELRPEGEPRDWTRAWTLTYFLWWLAWTPFVSVFIARISQGRTIRMFLFGAVVLPSVASWLWFSVFGGAGLAFQMDAGVDLGVTDFDTAAYSVYVLLEQLPFTLFIQIITLCLIFIFLVTSADSGAYVMAMFSTTQKGGVEPPRFERLFWGVILALLAISAFASDQGQSATRALAVVGAIPLFFLTIAQVIATSRLIWQDWRQSKE